VHRRVPWPGAGGTGCWKRAVVAAAPPTVPFPSTTCESGAAMPLPIAVCIERSNAPDEARYVQCVADVGREHSIGLGIDDSGTATWGRAEGIACELFATVDDRLALIRQQGAPEIVLERAGRSLALPVGKPVIVRDQDQLIVGGCRLRLHVHGRTQEVRPPAVFVRRMVAATATAMALGAAVVGCKRGAGDVEGLPIEVRDQPPKVDEPGRRDGVKASAGGAHLDAGPADAAGGAPEGSRGIEVRDRPPRSE